MEFPKGEPRGKIIRNDFDPNEFRKLVWAKGWRLTWRQCEACPCAESVDSDQGRMGCPACAAKGRIWHSPQEIRGLVTHAQKDDQELERQGSWYQGEIRLTLQPEHLPGIHDRFTALDTVFLFKEITERGATSVDRLIYPVAKREMDLDTGHVVRGVIRCRPQANDGSGSLTLLQENVDFIVNADGDIDWTLGIGLGSAPAAGRRVAFAYYAHPCFESYDDSFSARDTRIYTKRVDPAYAPMVVQTTCKLKYQGVR